MPVWVRAVALAGLIGLAVYSIWLLLGTDAYLPARDAGLYALLFVPALLLFAARWRLKDDTWPVWAIFTGASGLWLFAEVSSIATDWAAPDGVVWVQVLFLLVTVINYAALVLLIRYATPAAALDTYLDGLIIALAVTALISLPEPWAVAEGRPEQWHETFFAYGYPTVDLIQIAVIVAAIAVLRDAAGWAWWWLLAGSALIWIADSFWLLQVSLGEGLTNSSVDMLWPAGLLLMSMSAWTQVRRRTAVRYGGWTLPLLVTSVAFAIILYATFAPVPPLTVALATGAVLTGALRSISAYRAASARSHAQVLARTDDLTGLSNRRGLVAFIDKQPIGQRALLLVDIDRFKQINDTLGHQAGDDTLIRVADRFRKVVSPHVFIARIGGDEFALVMPEGSGLADATALAASLHEVLSQPVSASGLDLSVELSVGIALAPQHGTTLSELLRAADRGMYRAKRDHISTAVFDPAWEGSDSGNLLILQDLRAGLERDEFVCHYQPQLDVTTNQVVAVEALVRWEHPEQGMISAGQFLPMVEQTTLIRPLTDAILAKSLTQLQAWDAMGVRLRLSVNVSATNLMDRALPLRLTQLLSDHHIESGRLTLEITETALSGDEERVRTVLGQLHQIGVEISIDDYGSGYSSLHQIGTLGAQELKLDREFVTGVGDRGDLRSILAATVHLAHGLRLRMVAEGVESASDLDEVRLSGCDLAQGYFISPARDPQDLTRWLQERSVR